MWAAAFTHRRFGAARQAPRLTARPVLSIVPGSQILHLAKTPDDLVQLIEIAVMDDDLATNIFAAKLNIDFEAEQVRHRPLKRGSVRVVSSWDAP